ncbi:hypothetical protein AB0F91_46715 [Amycolatopsis sp. NPDC023774]|uniref:hypothetical protein n=1 Tax=Amycolatopsis sp. NPDC023774 TaxID=3155015 RepID=UPI00340E87AA
MAESSERLNSAGKNLRVSNASVCELVASSSRLGRSASQGLSATEALAGATSPVSTSLVRERIRAAKSVCSAITSNVERGPRQ